MFAEPAGVSLLLYPGTRTGRNALDVIRVLGRNRRLRLRPDHKLGDNTKRRSSAFQRLSIVRHLGHEAEGERNTYEEYVLVERFTCACNGTICEYDLDLEYMVKR